MDFCFSFLIEIGTKLNILFWSSTGNLNAPRADILTCRAVSSRNWYKKLLNQVQPTLVIPQHWETLFEPLSPNPHPFYKSPINGFPLRRINLQEFESKIHCINHECSVLIPKFFQSYRIDTINYKDKDIV